MTQCDGQINLMDLLAVDTVSEPPILLTEGQAVYKAVRGDVETHIVTGETWTCGDDNRGYRLKKIGGCWDCTWNLQINKVVFTNLESARLVAEQYLTKNEHILSQDIHAVRTVAYKYECYGSDKVNFYSVLENGNVYYRYGSTYEHIGKEAEIEDFEKGRQEHVSGYAELKDYRPDYKNMYKCEKHEKWLYAEARYGFIG